MKGITRSFYITTENNEKVNEYLAKEKYLSFSVFLNKILDDFLEKELIK